LRSSKCFQSWKQGARAHGVYLLRTGETLLRVRQPDHNDDATHRVAPATGRDLRVENEFYSSAFPSRVPDACGPRGSSGRIQRAAVSDGVHSSRSHDPASLVGSFRPNAPPQRFAWDSRRRSVPGSSSGIERLPGLPTRTWHLDRRLGIWAPSQTETPPATAGQFTGPSDAG
jgi:hypothetical protein